MLALMESLVDPLRDISPHYRVLPKAHNGSMFRIYRDTRFSHDKKPYKENIGCQFRHEAGKSAHAPGFYLHLEPGNVFAGGGVWLPPSPVLNKIRLIISAFPKSWEQVVTSTDLLALTQGVEGESLKRCPAGIDPTHPYIDDLKRKSFFAMRYFTDEEACDAEFVVKLRQTFNAVSPLMKFLTQSLELRY